MKTYLRKIVAFINDEEGASAIEYALLVGLIALAIVGRGDCSWHQASTVCLHGRRRSDAAAPKRAPDLRGAGAGASGLRPLSYEGNQSCRGHRGMQPQRPAPTLGAEPGGVMGYRAPDHGLLLS